MKSFEQISISDPYLSEQIITYIGNKRKLLPYIEAVVKDIQNQIGKTKLVCGDLFSGSGIVARLLKYYSSVIITNDMEDYSRLINDCYLTNVLEFDNDKYEKYKVALDTFCDTHQIRGIIANNYAPFNDGSIKEGERVFYTTRNAIYIDTAMYFIMNYVEKEFQKFFIAPLLYESSVHVNTSGVFKGFYKNSNTGIGQYGGDARNCLDRIESEIRIKKPILCKENSVHISCQGDTNATVDDLPYMDFVYLDPPYNQHSYGSNYFMLNTILNYRLGNRISKISGIPSDWNRSLYNKRNTVKDALEDLIARLRCSYVAISYNNEGFIGRDDMELMLKKYGELKTISIKYNAFRASRNLRSRSQYVDEYVFVLRKGG